MIAWYGICIPSCRLSSIQSCSRLCDARRTHECYKACPSPGQFASGVSCSRRPAPCTMRFPAPHPLLALLAVACATSASPISDTQVREFLARRDSSLRPLHLTRRDAAGYQTRHLRPEEYIPMAKRDGISAPDVGQIATFTSGVPEPSRLALGGSFLANSNHQLDMQNVDNVAGPTTDAGASPHDVTHS